MSVSNLIESIRFELCEGFKMPRSLDGALKLAKMKMRDVENDIRMELQNSGLSFAEDGYEMIVDGIMDAIDDEGNRPESDKDDEKLFDMIKDEIETMTQTMWQEMD